MANTPNYSLPLFDANQPADLMGVVNEGFTDIDSELKTINDSLASAGGGGFTPNPGSDAAVTVDDIKKLKITSNGIVYKPSE